MGIKQKRAELVAPAGNLEKLSYALSYGADAVYLGGRDFNLRSKSSNFSFDELIQAINLVKSSGKKVYLTLNSLLRNSKIEALKEFIVEISKTQLDSVIVSDLGVLSLIKENSNLDVHISTQTSTCNWKAASMWYKLGASRVVLARELSLEEITEIKQRVPELELEVFIHGAMCMAYSGRCNLSLYLASRSANEGACSHSCRWKYYLSEEKRKNEFMPVYEDESGSFIYSSKDLCTIRFLDKILDCGVDALKIEGRMKGLLYIATTTNVYRKILDLIEENKDSQLVESVVSSIEKELTTYTNRGYTSGFYFGYNNLDTQRYKDLGYDKEYELVATVIQKLPEYKNSYLIEIRNRLVTGTKVEVLTPYLKESILAEDLKSKEFQVPKMIDPDTNETLDVVSPTKRVRIDLDSESQLAISLKPKDLLRQLIG